MRTPLRLRLVVAITALALALSGCGGMLTGGPAAAGQKKIAVLLYSQGFEFMVALNDGIKAEAARLGVDVVVLDAREDSAKQTQQIEDQLARGVDGILLSPNNSEELVPGVQKINAAHTPVVTVDSVVAGAEVNASVAYDNIGAGRMAAEYLASLMNGTGTVLEYQGAKGAYHAIRRGDGFTEGIGQSPGISVIGRDSEWTATQALSLTVDNLTANPSINGMFSHNDEMVRGIVSGQTQVGRGAGVGQPGHIPLIGIDGTPLALQRIRDGSQDATMDQDPYTMGALALRTLIEILDGKQVPKQQLTEPKLITRANVDDPNLWGNKFQP